MSDQNTKNNSRQAPVRIAMAMVAALAAAPLAVPTAAQAESNEFGQQEVVDEFTPGVWHKLGGDNSPMYLAMMRVEEMTGARFCKVLTREGWHTDFVDCRPQMRGELVNRLRIAEEGIMFSEGFSAFNPAYFHSPNQHDRSLTKKLREAFAYVRAGRHLQIVEEPNADTTVLAERRVNRAAQARAQYLTGLVNGRQIRLKMEIK